MVPELPFTETTERFALLLLPHFSLFSLACVIDPLRVANRLANQRLYAWTTLAVTGNSVEASNGLPVAVDSVIDRDQRFETSIVCGGFDGHRHADERALAWLRRQDRFGGRLGAVTTGTWALAKAGLLNDTRCTIHWEEIPSFQAEFPEVELVPDLFVQNGRRFTCSGGTSVLDMTLHLIAMRCGQGFAMQVSEQFIHNHLREPGEEQRLALRTRLGVPEPMVLLAVELMERHVEDAVTIQEIADRIGISRRQLEREFLKNFGQSPKEYYTSIRLRRGRHLVKQTSMSMIEIAIECGYVSASHFAKQYKLAFGLPPVRERANTRALTRKMTTQAAA